MAALAANSTRTFQCVEQGFFTRWWDSATLDQRNNVRQFVKEGRWEFAVGGWVMPDEAVADYEAVIDSMTLGLQFIFNEFGVLPTVGFQVDPFGASTSFAWISNQLGFSAHVISRIS